MGTCCSTPAEDQAKLQSNDSGSASMSSVGERLKNKNGIFDSMRKTSVELTSGSSGPRIHKSRDSMVRRMSETSEEQRGLVSLVGATDEQLLQEVYRRKINIHERVTKELVTSKYKFGKLLGQGASASVFECVHIASGKSVAVKVIKRDDEMNDDDSMSTELEILRTVRHRYLLNCIELYESPHCIWVVMELIRGGELLDTLIETGTYDETDAARAMKQVLLAIRYLHSQGVVHRDLKLQNLLMSTKDKNTADTKVADFGLSAILPKHEFEPADKDAMKAFNKLSDRWGTPHYFAPEMIGKAYGPQVDLWALGVVLFQLLAGRLPFNGENARAIFEQVLNSQAYIAKLMALPEWSAISEAAKDFVLKLLEKDPKVRFNADEALNHPWIVLKGETGGGNLASAHAALKQQVAKRRIADMWHVLDIINSLESAGAVSGGSTSKGNRMLSPSLVHQASVTASAFGADVPDSPVSMPKGRPRAASKTDMFEELQSVFDLFDRDGDGTIDAEELSTLMKKLGFEPNEEKLMEVVRSVDKNGNGKLEFDEFCDFLKAAKNKIGIDNAIEEQLTATMADENGYVNSSDIRQFIGAFSEHLGQAMPEEQIEAIISLSEAQDGHAKAHDLVEAMMTPPDALKVRASVRSANNIRGSVSDSI